MRKCSRSPHPYARVVSVDTTKAESHPKVKGVAAIKDVPKVVGTIGNMMTEKGRSRLYLQDNVVGFIGDPVAVVAAEDEASALEALALIDVAYGPLPTVFDPMEALKEDAPKIHEGGNIAFHLERRLGDLDRGFEEAIIVESNEPTAAFGAKGVGEITNVGTAAAIANAVYDAVGVRITDLPITQEKVLEGISTGKVER